MSIYQVCETLLEHTLPPLRQEEYVYMDLALWLILHANDVQDSEVSRDAWSRDLQQNSALTATIPVCRPACRLVGITPARLMEILNGILTYNVAYAEAPHHSSRWCSRVAVDALYELTLDIVRILSGTDVAFGDSIQHRFVECTTLGALAAARVTYTADRILRDDRELVQAALRQSVVGRVATGARASVLVAPLQITLDMVVIYQQQLRNNSIPGMRWVNSPAGPHVPPPETYPGRAFMPAAMLAKLIYVAEYDLTSLRLAELSREDVQTLLRYVWIARNGLPRLPNTQVAAQSVPQPEAQIAPQPGKRAITML